MGNISRVVCSSVISVETATTTIVDAPSTVQTQPVCTLSTSSGSSNMESYSCLSTSTVRPEPIPHGLTKTNSPLDVLFHLYEDILEAMTELDFPWDIMHHRSFFLPEKAFGPNNLENQ